MHGGDIYNNEIEYDFSVNVNPFGPYEEVIDVVKNATSKLNVYPEYNSENLRNKLAECYQISTENICVTNGASEAISVLINSPYVSDVVIEVPSFYGYEKSANPEQQIHAFTRKSFLKLNENIIPKSSIVVMGNPSNPTGEYTDSFIIESLYKRVKESGSILLIDESFMSLSDYSDQSFIYKIRENKSYYDHLVVVRSFTKSFAISALRLGYIVSGNERLIKHVQDSLPEWNVSYLAQEAGLECLKHINRLVKDFDNIKTQRKELIKSLEGLGFLVHESNTNYILFLANKDLYDKLLKEKILIRDCSNYRGISEVVDEMICKNISINSIGNNSSNCGVYRIAVKTKEENEILINAIKKCLDSL